MLSKRVLVGVFLGVAITASAQTIQWAPGVDVQTLQERWRTALLAANMDALDAIYSDGLVYVHSDGQIQNKQQFLGPIKAGTLRFTALTGCDVPRIRAHEAAAIVIACYELQAGSAPPSRHLFLTVYINEAGQWRIVAQQTTRLPDKP
jgi:hypothetical protein